MEQVFEHLMTVYNSLTDFQKATVETIISKFNNGNDRRVLVADEVGLGKTIVEGGKSLRFSPKYPKKVLQLSSPEMTLKDTQKEFFNFRKNILK